MCSKNLESWLVKILKYASFMLIFYGLYFCVWTLFNTETGNGDNVEHIHSTWLVAHKKVPYRDFFQHHNPLVWYTFAPFIRLLPHALLLLDLAHFIGMLAGIITFYIVYLIAIKFFSSKQAALLSLILLCPAHFYIFCFNFNPDTFMALFLALGIYYLFSYFEKATLVKLCLSFLSFFISFMYTQKVLIILGMLGIISLYVF